MSISDEVEDYVALANERDIVDEPSTAPNIALPPGATDTSPTWQCWPQ